MAKYQLADTEEETPMAGFAAGLRRKQSHTRDLPAFGHCRELMEMYAPSE